MSDAAAIVDQLTNSATLLGVAEVSGRDSAVPKVRGIYAWYFGNLPAVPSDGCPMRDGMTLLYVGIAPSRATSRKTLRSRVRNHASGSANGSTLRRSLGALLASQLGIELRPVGISGKTNYGEGEEALSDWMRLNARVTWAEHAEPWVVERKVIEILKPPLNLADHPSNAFAAELKRLRA